MDRESEAAGILSAVPCFSGLEAEVLRAVAGVAVRRRYDAGEMVLLEGEPAGGLYAVEEGWLKATKSDREGREQVIRFVGPGESFNDVSVFADSPNLGTVVALEPTAVWMVPREELLRLLERHGALARAVVVSLAERATYLLSLVEDLSLRSVEARLARFLVEGAAGDGLSRRRWTTQAQIAARLGTVPDVLNRALRGLVEEGLISVDRHQIRVHDLPELRARALMDP